MKNDFLTEHRTVVLEKVKESALSVIPIVAIVVILCLTVTPLGTDLLLCFLVGALLLVLGMGFFFTRSRHGNEPHRQPYRHIAH